MATRKRTMDRLVRMYESQGCTVTNGRSGTRRVKTPSGVVIQLHTTPRDNHEQLNYLRQQTRRAGLDWTL